MGIKEFFKGQFTPMPEELNGKDPIEKKEFQNELDGANENLAVNEELKRMDKEEFIDQYKLMEIDGFEDLKNDDIVELMDFASNKTGLSQDEKEKLKKEVQEKAKNKITELTLKEAA